MPYGTPTTDSGLTKAITINTLRKMKADGEKFVTVALYDAPMAAMAKLRACVAASAMSVPGMHESFLKCPS